MGTAEVASSRVEMYARPVNNNNLPYAPYLFTCITAMGQARRPVIPLTYIRVLPVSTGLKRTARCASTSTLCCCLGRRGDTEKTRPHLPIVWVAK